VENLNLGKIITDDQQRDAIHIAVAPVVAASDMGPGDHVGLDASGRATMAKPPIGIVDPYLKTSVRKGQRFWLFIYPNTVTDMRHHWVHPSFTAQETIPQVKAEQKSASEKWMRAWAMEHMSKEYEDDDEPWSEQTSYDMAIQAGHSLCVGNRMDARDHIDNEWWGHWENITGEPGQRGEHFSCGC
jgi:hypothetical protein